MFSRFPYACARLILLVLILALTSGCGAGGVNAVFGGAVTPTADATLLAVPVMLTQTAEALAVARAATRTPTPPGTPTVVPSIPIPQTGSQDAPANPGERVLYGSYALIVLPPKQITAVGSQKAAQGRAFLEIEVSLENTGNRSVPYAALFFHLGDPAAPKTEIQPSPLNSPQTPALLSGELAPGDSVRGHLFFDIPQSGGGYRVRFDPRGNSQAAVWVDPSQPRSQASLPLPASPARLPGLGKRVEASGEALTLQSVTARQTYGRFKPGSGNLFVELDVVIENVKLTSVSYNAEYFRIKDSQGYEYPSTVIPNETLLLAGSLTEGRQVSGHVIFEVPTNVQGLVVTYQPVVIGQTFEPIKVQIQLPALH